MLKYNLGNINAGDYCQTWRCKRTAGKYGGSAQRLWFLQEIYLL